MYDFKFKLFKKEETFSHFFFKFPKHIFNSENINLLIAIELFKIKLIFLLLLFYQTSR